MTVCVFLVWIFVLVPTIANSCISKSAVCCLLGNIEGKIFFDEIEGSGCSNRGSVQVIFNLIGLGREGYGKGQTPYYHFRLKTYGEIVPACSGLGDDFGYNSGYIAAIQPLDDGSVYNDTTFLPGKASGLGTDALIGRSVAIYEGLPSRQSTNQRPIGCCVVGRGQPVSLPAPSPTEPTPLGSNTKPIDLSVAQQTKDPLVIVPDVVNLNPGTPAGLNPIVNLGQKSPNLGVNKGSLSYPTNNNGSPNNIQPNNVPGKGISYPNNNIQPKNVPGKAIYYPINNRNPNAANNNNNINNNNNKFNLGEKKNPKYKFDEGDIDNKFNLIGGYGGGDGFDSYNPRNSGNANHNNNNNNNNNNGDYSNVYDQGNNNYNMNTADVFGSSNTSPPRGTSSNNGGRGYPSNNNKNFNNFNNNDNRNRGFGSSQFPSVFGSIGTGAFFNLDGKLAGAALIKSNPRNSKGFGGVGGGVGGLGGSSGSLGSSLGNGFEPPKGPSFQDIYNKPTGESPLSSSGFSDAVSPEEENSISRLFFNDPSIKDTIGLTSEDRFIPRETEDEEESTEYRSRSDTADDDDDEEEPSGGARPDFSTDVNNLSAGGGYISGSDNPEGSSDIQSSSPREDQIPSDSN